MDNDDLVKVSRGQVSALRPVSQTDLENPDFGGYAELCGVRASRVDRPE